MSVPSRQAPRALLRLFSRVGQATVCIVYLLPSLLRAASGDSNANGPYPPAVAQVLTTYCYDCHGDGMEKGKVAFDEFQTPADLETNRDLFLHAVKNVRAGIMPPRGKPRPEPSQEKVLSDWVKSAVFGLDPQNPDPGKVTLRRLNRVEYRNTIADLTGFDFKVEDELPPDDTGYGFDDIGDVLTLSPLLLEKYMAAAETISAQAVPRVARVAPEQPIGGKKFTGTGDADHLSFYEPADLAWTNKVDFRGKYRLKLDLEVRGQFEFDPGKCRTVLKVDGRNAWTNDFAWQNGKKFSFDIDQAWDPGDHCLDFSLQPLTPAAQKQNSLALKLRELTIIGPIDGEHGTRPKGFERFFFKDPPKAAKERRQYARDVLSRFATKAYRRPVDDRTVNRLLSIAEAIWKAPGKKFEDGIAEAIIPILASPRFLFRVEQVETPGTEERFPALDEYSLASRLSYFLWSTMPDDELMDLASRHMLRKNLDQQVERMVKDARSRALVDNFVGQWLQVRDLEGININERVVLARDRGEEGQLERRFKRFRELQAIPKEKRTPEQQDELQRMIDERRKRSQQRQDFELDEGLRQAMRHETEMAFAYGMRENRSVLELVRSDYTFLNERLATHYGITNVSGGEMRKVSLPADSPRGGVLTDGSILIVTSNPTRTSPVKRGLFILDNILGLPTPPPPANIPPLEDSEKGFTNHPPTLRETLEIHRSKPLCSSCHNRMDPLGLALENFNALGMWRDGERGEAIDSSGILITGEEFHDIREVKEAIVSRHRLDFYRCLTEKLLTYALGRGMEYYDLETVDQIVQSLDQADGRFSALLNGIIHSAAFQKTRNPSQHFTSSTTKERSS